MTRINSVLYHCKVSSLRRNNVHVRQIYPPIRFYSTPQMDAGVQPLERVAGSDDCNDRSLYGVYATLLTLAIGLRRGFTLLLPSEEIPSMNDLPSSESPR